MHTLPGMVSHAELNASRPFVSQSQVTEPPLLRWKHACMHAWFAMK